MQNDLCEKKENVKRNSNYMTEIWPIELKGLQWQITGLLKEIRSYNKSKNLIKKDEQWLQRLKLREVKTF